MEESEHITAAQKAMADLKDNLRAIVKINWGAGNLKVALVRQEVVRYCLGRFQRIVALLRRILARIWKSDD